MITGATSGIGADWLPRLESSLATNGGEPAVAAAVGVAFAERQLWGKARRLLEQAAAELPDFLFGLGTVLEAYDRLEVAEATGLPARETATAVSPSRKGECRARNAAAPSVARSRDGT